MRSFKLLFTIYLLSFLVADPFKPLNTDFLNKGISPQKVSNSTIPKKNSKKNLPSYDEVIKDYKIIEGLFTVFWNKEKNNL